jgi:predicted nucleic acid-binding protein
VTDYYLDSSSLVKRYADEWGSSWIRQITDLGAGNSILLPEITLAEVAAAMAAKQRMSRGITEEQRARALGRFLQDCGERFLLVLVDRAVVYRAVELTQAHSLRGYDAVQLATALTAGVTLQADNLAAPIFVASGKELLNAAKADTLHGENPHDQD